MEFVILIILGDKPEGKSHKSGKIRLEGLKLRVAHNALVLDAWLSVAVIRKLAPEEIKPFLLILRLLPAVPQYEACCYGKNRGTLF